MKNAAITGGIILFLLFVSVECFRLYLSEKQEARRWEDNYTAAAAEAERYKTAAGDAAVKITAQEMTIAELKKALPAVIADIKAAGIRPGAVHSFTENTAVMGAHIAAPLKYATTATTAPTRADTTPERVRSFEYTDKWFSTAGIIRNDSIIQDISGIDTIQTIIYSQRRHPWAWILSKKQIKAVTVNKNPGIDITPLKAIYIKL